MFKNMTMYCIASSWQRHLQALEDALQNTVFEKCGEAHGPLVESVAGQWVMRFMTEAKVLPASTLNRKVDEKAEHIEMTEGRKPGRKEKRDLKDEAKLDLLPMRVGEVLPSLLRDWVSEMDCSSKAIRNMLTPLRSLFEDALNDELIDFNPFERIALSKLIRQTAKASDYVVTPFTSAEREAILKACRPDERPMLQFWFETGLRPGELQALQWRHIDLERAIARIELNQVAGVIKGTKTAAGIRDVELSAEALAALCAQRPISELKGERIWLNPRTGESWSTNAQIRKTPWQPACKRAEVEYRNPHTKSATPMPQPC
ncbi:MAG: recombination-associated protein RdgC [Comamonas testosteroni]|uniref:tyrosine-type recombinase/integrase n=1 Tax=Comamonas testosteroni TaxID=285 RepID=UPI003D0C39E2